MRDERRPYARHGAGDFSQLVARAFQNADLDESSIVTLLGRDVVACGGSGGDGGSGSGSDDAAAGGGRDADRMRRMRSAVADLRKLLTVTDDHVVRAIGRAGISRGSIILGRVKKQALPVQDPQAGTETGVGMGMTTSLPRQSGEDKGTWEMRVKEEGRVRVVG